MAWNIPELDASDRFEPVWKGVTYSLPKLGDVSLDTMELFQRIQHSPDKTELSDIKAMFAAIDEDFGKVVGQLGATQLRALFQEWQEESGITVGESSPSVES